MVEPISAKDIIARMGSALEAGLGFVPLIGSGISVASGIPTIGDIARKLQVLATRVMTDPHLVWDPRDPDWRLLVPATRDNQPESDWRAVLDILSRVHATVIDDRKRLRFLVPEETTIDTAFAYLIRRANPNTAHLMLAHLADALRIRTIMTTNFDSLIEQAFDRLGMPLTRYDVNFKAFMPSTALLKSQRSIIKLNGGSFGLRADTTLDDTPSRVDQRRFTNLFRDDHGTRRHLLVMGVGGAENRTNHLIDAALKGCSDLKVFWIGYSRGSIKCLDRGVFADHRDRICSAVVPDLGLFLLQLYQTIYRALPPSGAEFPVVFRVPPERYPPRGEASALPYDEAQLTENVRRLQDALDERDAPAKIWAVEGDGVSSVAGELFDRLRESGPGRGPSDGLWIELDQFADEQDLLIGLMEAVSHKMGRWSLEPPPPVLNWQTCAADLAALIQDSPRPFVVVINGRDGPGEHAGLAPRPWSPQAMDAFWTQLPALANDRLRFVVLYGNKGLTAPPGPSADIRILPPLPTCMFLKPKDIIASVQQWLSSPPPGAPGGGGGQQPRLRFVFALTLLRHSRHLAVLTSWGLIKAAHQAANIDNDRERARLTDQWIDELAARFAIRRRPGGTIWMHRDVRIALQKELAAANPALAAEQAACHQGIADWYLKLYRSSNDPLAALESLYHRKCCIETAQGAAGNRTGFGEPDDVRRSSIIECIETLRLSRDRLMASGCLRPSQNVLTELAAAAEQWSAEPGSCRADALELSRIALELLRDARKEAAQFITAAHIVARLKPRYATASDAHRVPANYLLYDEAVCHMGLRDYVGADLVFAELFSRLGLVAEAGEAPARDGWPFSGMKVAQVRSLAHTAAGQPADVLALAIKALRRFMFLQMLKVQALELSEHRERASADDGLASAEKIYTLATTLMRYLGRHDFLQIENAFIRTHYGVLMAIRGRYKEAHRRLNEAASYLWQSSRQRDQVALAVVDLRRAEIHLNEAAQAATPRCQAVMREDADAMLHQAAGRLAGQHKDIWWWTWLYELQLRVQAETAQSQRATTPEIERIVIKAQRLIDLDLLRQARLARLADALLEPDHPLSTLCQDRLSNLLDRMASPMEVPGLYCPTFRVYQPIVDYARHAVRVPAATASC